MSRKQVPYGWIPAATLLILAALACGAPGEIAPEPTAVPPEAPPEAPAPQESKDPVPSGDTYELEIDNQSSEAICFIQISPAANKEWGDDWLGDEVILPDSTFTFTNLSGTYDLRALDCETNQMGLQEKVTFTEDMVWTFTDAGSQTSGSAGSAGPSGVSTGDQTVELEVINQSSATICYVYISLSSEKDLGPDWLGDSSIIDPRSTYTFNVPPGTYDLFATDCDGELLGVQAGVDLSSSRTWTFSDTSSQTGDSSGYCGDEICTDAELAANNCPFDCGGWENYCGDGICNSGEDVSSCAEDCGRCGDGLCTTFENSGNCPQDCGSPQGGSVPCGDGICEPYEEDEISCPADCG